MHIGRMLDSNTVTMVKGNKYEQFVLDLGLMHQHSLNILFELDIVEVHSFSELEECVF